MKAAILCREYPPYVYGGAGVHVKYLSQELAKIMDVEVRCFGDQNVREKGRVVRGYKGWDRLKCGEKFAPVLATLSTNLETMCDKWDADIVHTHTWYAHFGGFMAQTLFGIPFVATCHSLEPLRPWKEHQLGRGYQLSTFVETLGITQADRIVAVSKVMKDDILKCFKVAPEKIDVIHNGIDLDVWQRRPLDPELKAKYGIKDDYILFIGRPTPQKGMEHLLAAADKIPVQIVLGAVGADTKEYEDRMIEEAKKKPNIVWIHELLKENEYSQLYSAAKVFVCPSVYEPFGIINLEAMACGTPVVASEVGGIPEVVVPGETGFLVPPAQPEAIAECVNRLLKDPATARRYGDNGRKRVEAKFSWSYIARQTKAMYENLVEEKKRAEAS
ncbi:MAG: glycogen synthase [Planctomycetota bacterium]